MAELKPCPFCGGEAQMHTRFDSLESFANKKSEIPKTARLVCERKYPNKPKYYVYRQLLYVPQCTRTNCMGRTTKNFEFEEDAIKAWNTRTQKDMTKIEHSSLCETETFTQNEG